MENRDKKLNILIWRAEYNGPIVSGGFATYWQSITNAFLSLGHNVVFVSAGEMIVPENVPLYKIPHNQLLKNLPEVLTLTYNFKAFKKVKEIVKDHNIDLIFLQHHDFQIFSYLVNQDLKIPIFLHVDGIQNWVKKNWSKLYLNYLSNVTEKIQLHYGDALFCVSNAVIRLLVEYGVNKEKLFLSPSSVDPSFFHPSKSGIEIRQKFGLESKFVAGFVGTFGHWHGVNIIAKSIKKTVELLPNAMFLLVGDGVLIEEVNQIIETEGVQDYVIKTGMVDYSEVPNYMAACDVLLTPCISNSDGSEMFNSPIKLFEYMAMQKPIIASAVGQQSDVLLNLVNGILIPENNSEELAKQIRFIFDNPKLSENMSKQARKDVEENYSWEKNAKKIINVYQDLVKK